MTASDPRLPGPDDAPPAPRRATGQRDPEPMSSAAEAIAWAPVTIVPVDDGLEPENPRRTGRPGWWLRVEAAGAWLLLLAAPSRGGPTVGAESLTDRQLVDIGLTRADLPDLRGWRR